MNLNTQCAFSNLITKANYIFIYLIFSLPFISFSFIQNSTKTGQELYLISVISFWLFLSSLLFLQKSKINILVIDFLFVMFLFYGCIHFYYLSYFGFLCNQFFIFTGYIIMFFLLRLCFSMIKEESYFNVMVYFIYVIALIQSFIAIMQNFNFIKSSNNFFIVVGTYINPNFLGVGILFGLIVSIYIFSHLIHKKSIKYLLVFFSLIMAYALILTECRAAWITLGIVCLYFLFTSKKYIFYFRNNQKKTLIVFSTFVILIISSLYWLYTLNPDSVNGRSFIQKISVTKISENPFFGNGISNFKPIYNQAKAQYFLDAQRPWNEIKVADYVTVAFNDYIQVLFEIGIIGFLLIVFLLLYLVNKINFNRKTRLALAIILSCSSLAFFTSVLYNPNAMIYLIWSLAILSVYGKTSKIIFRIENKGIVKCMAVLVFLISLIAGYVSYKKLSGLADFKTISEDASQKIYYKLNDTDLRFIQEDPYVEFKVGFEKYQENKLLGIKLMENAIKKDPNPKANIVLANLFLLQKKYSKSEILLKNNIGLQPSRFEPLVNLMDFYNNTNQFHKKIIIAEKILNLPIKIKSKKIDIYKQKAQTVLDENIKTTNLLPRK